METTTNDKQDFIETFKQNLAFAQLAGMHPEMIVEIDAAWGEHLLSVGWDKNEYIRAVTAFKQRSAVDALVPHGAKIDPELA